MVELFEASDADRALLAQRLGPALDDRTAAWFEKEVQNKNLNVETIFEDGRKVAAVWWWFSPTNQSLVLNGGASFVQDDTTAAMMQAYQILAERTGAKSMELVTARAGVAKIYRKAGWLVEGLQLRKVL